MNRDRQHFTRPRTTQRTPQQRLNGICKLLHQRGFDTDESKAEIINSYCQSKGFESQDQLAQATFIQEAFGTFLHYVDARSSTPKPESHEKGRFIPNPFTRRRR